MNAKRLDRWAKIAAIVAVVGLALPAGIETVRIARGGSTADAWRSGIDVTNPDDVARMMAEGKNVIFVDVREPAEYAQYHVPGALSIPLRDVAGTDPSRFSGADLVIPYCLKDFRGFEGARALQGLGIENVGLVEGFGINAWKRADLPTAGSHPGDTDEAALRALVERIQAAPSSDGRSDGQTDEKPDGQSNEQPDDNVASESTP